MKIIKDILFCSFISVVILLFSFNKLNAQIKEILDVIEKARYGSGGHVIDYTMTFDQQNNLYLGWIEVVTREDGSTIDQIFLRKISQKGNVIFKSKEIAETLTIFNYPNIDIYADSHNNVYLFWSESNKIHGEAGGTLTFAKVSPDGRILIPKTHTEGTAMYRSVTEDQQGNIHILGHPWHKGIFYVIITEDGKVVSKNIKISRTEALHWDFRNDDYPIVFLPNRKILVLFKFLNIDFKANEGKGKSWLSEDKMQYMIIDTEEGKITTQKTFDVKEKAFRIIPDVWLPKIDAMRLGSGEIVVSVGVKGKEGKRDIYQIKFDEKGRIMKTIELEVKRKWGFKEAISSIRKRLQIRIGEKGKLKELFLYGLDEKGRFYYEKKSF